MRRAVLVLCLTFIFLSYNTYAVENQILDIRNKIFQESKELKELLLNTKDVILVNSLWDSCVISITQLDAYFSMLRIFNTIRSQDLTEATIRPISDWLNSIKDSNNINIRTLSGMRDPIEQNIKPHIEKLKNYYNDLNRQIDAELNKLSTIRQSLKIKPRR
ncbi:MAG: hypothetical protein NC908_01600 [Candidatus Omnitrophica bacterium]|nr:hypothetical protein [Candidatus Omnitrophota bacterium]